MQFPICKLIISIDPILPTNEGLQRAKHVLQLKESLLIIQNKDSSKENMHNIKDLKLEQDAKITKTDYELKKQLSVYPQKHGIKNMTKHLKERIHKTISELPSENTNQDDVSDGPSIID